jgi:hypothetical protein
MPNPRTEHLVICSFTSQEWTGRPDDGAGATFVRFAVVGFVLCLFLMLFVPLLRVVGFTMIIVTFFATICTALSIRAKASRERAVLQRLTATVNEVVLELTADKTKQLSAENFRSLLSGGSRPLPVNGVSGLHLKVVGGPSPKPKQNALAKPEEVTTTHVVLAATPPDYGIGSFDRLLETVTTDPGFNSPGT